MRAGDFGRDVVGKGWGTCNESPYSLTMGMNMDILGMVNS